MLRKYWWLFIILIPILIGALFINRSQEDPLIAPSVTDTPFKGAQGQDIERDGIFHSLAVSLTDPNTVFVGTETNAIFKSTDGGATWTWLRTRLLHNKRSYPEVYDILINPQNEQIVYAALTNGPIPPDFELAAGFYRSTDGGQSWSRYITGLPNTSVDSLGFDPANPAVLYLGLNAEDPSFHLVQNLEIEGGIYRSTDGGESWQPLSHPDKIHGSRIERILVHGQTIVANGLRFKGEDSRSGPRSPDVENAIGLIKSTNGGQSWQNITPQGAFAYYFDASQDLKVIYLADDQGNSYISRDTGQTWTKAPVYAGGVIKVSPHDPQKVLFATGGQLHLSLDGLQSYKVVLEIEPGHGIDDIEFTSDPNTIYIGADGYHIYKSVDAAQTFTQIANLREYITNHK